MSRTSPGYLSRGESRPASAGGQPPATSRMPSSFPRPEFGRTRRTRRRSTSEPPAIRVGRASHLRRTGRSKRGNDENLGRQKKLTIIESRAECGAACRATHPPRDRRRGGCPLPACLAPRTRGGPATGGGDPPWRPQCGGGAHATRRGPSATAAARAAAAAVRGTDSVASPCRSRRTAAEGAGGGGRGSTGSPALLLEGPEGAAARQRRQPGPRASITRR
jgi:hypothetical protein